MLEKSRELLHKRKCQEQKSSKGHAAQIAAREEWESNPRAKEAVSNALPDRLTGTRCSALGCDCFFAYTLLSCRLQPLLERAQRVFDIAL
jgi:hypothetical protein